MILMVLLFPLFATPWTAMIVLVFIQHPLMNERIEDAWLLIGIFRDPLSESTHLSVNHALTLPWIPENHCGAALSYTGHPSIVAVCGPDNHFFTNTDEP